MLPFLCFRCFHVSNSVDGLRCPRCDGEGSGTVMAENSHSAIPEYGNESPGYYVTVEDASTQVSEEDLVPEELTREASTQVSEEDLVPEEPTREASTQVSEEDLVPEEPTREASTQVSEDDLGPVEQTREASTQTSDDDLPFQIAGSHGYENCLKSDGPPQNQASRDFDQYTNSNQNELTHSNTNEGEFQNESYGIFNAANLLTVMDDKPSTSQQTYICEQFPLGEGENESSSDELLRRQGLKEPIEHGINSDSFAFTDSITLESKYPAENLLSNSTEKVEDRQDSIPPPFSFCPRGNRSMNKCFQENSVTAISVAQQPPQASNKFSKWRCEKCNKYFFKERTFYAHLKKYCNPRKPYKCEECGAISWNITALLAHRRVHTGEKPFKCTQCDFTSKWPSNLNRHLKTHTNIPPSSRNPSVNKSFQENLVTIKQKNPQPSLKFKIIRCKKCKSYFFCKDKNPFKCGQCGDRFSSMHRLIRHGRVHKGEKTFKCTQCDHATKWPHLPKKHLMKYSKIQSIYSKRCR